MEERFDCRPAQWLRRLFYAHIAGVVISIVSLLLPEGLQFWVAQAVPLAVMFCLYSLGPENDRYRKAALFLGISLALTVLNRFVPFGLFTTAASVLAILAAYQEYHAHSMIILGRDSNLAWKWQKLFIWEIVVGVLTVVLAMVSVLIGLLGEIGAFAITTILTVLAVLVQLVLEIIYFVYLYRTIRLMEEREYTI